MGCEAFSSLVPIPHHLLHETKAESPDHVTEGDLLDYLNQDFPDETSHSCLFVNTLRTLKSMLERWLTSIVYNV